MAFAFGLVTKKLCCTLKFGLCKNLCMKLLFLYFLFFGFISKIMENMCNLELT